MKSKLLFVVVMMLVLSTVLGSCFFAPKISDIVIKEGTLTTEYTVGDTPDFSAVKATVKYDNGDTKEVGSGELKFSALDTSTEGTKVLTISYEDFSINVNINVKKPADEPKPATLATIEVVAASIPATAIVGKGFDASGIQVEAKYSDGTVAVVGIDDGVTLSALDLSSAGDKTLTVTYGGKQATVNVKVIGVTAMVIIADTLADEIDIGDALDTSKIQAQVTYTDGTAGVIEAADLTIGTIDVTTAGKKILTISYGGFTYEHEVEVVALLSVDILAGSVASKIMVGETYSTAGIKLKATYTNGDETIISGAALTVSGIDTTTAGVKTLTVSYGGMSDTLSVTVIGVKDIIIAGYKSEIKVGETYAIGATNAVVTFTDNTQSFVSVSALTVGSVDTATKGAKKLSVSYLDKTVELDVLVYTTESIKITGAPASFLEGVAPDLTKIKVYLVWGNGDEELVTGYESNIASLDFSACAAQTLTVSYQGFSASATIAASARELTSIEIISAPAKIYVKSEYDKSAVVVKAYYNNGTEEQLTLGTAGFVIGDIGTDSATETTLTVSYGDKQDSMIVEVVGVQSITVSSYNNEVKVGTEYVSGITSAAVVYTDGTSANVPASALNIGSVDTTAAAAKKLSVGYLDGSVDLDVKVYGIKGIEVAFDGFVTENDADYVFDYSKLTVKIVWDDSRETREVITEGYTTNVADLTFGDAEAKTLEVYYEGYTGSTIISRSEPVLESIAINTYKASVIIGAEYDNSSVSIKATYNNGNVVTITDGLVIGAIDTSAAGEQTLTVEYGGMSIDLTITVAGVQSIEIPAYNSEVKVGTDYVNGIAYANVTFTNGDTAIVYAEDLTFGSISTDTTGTKQLSVQYLGGVKILNVLVYGVADIVVEGVPASSLYGLAPDFSAIKVYAVYGNAAASRELLDSASYTTNIASLDFSGEAAQTLVVSYGAIEKSFVITREAPTLISIEIITYAQSVRAGATYDVGAVVVEATYNNGIKTLTNGENGLAVVYANGTLTATIGDKSDEKTINVITITQIVANGLPEVVEIGNALNTSALNVLVIYSDGTSETVTTGITVEGFNKDVKGDQTVTVKCLGASTTVIVHVRALESIKILGGSVASVVRPGYDVDTKKLAIIATYTNGAVDITSGFTTNAVTVGNKVILTVSFGGKTDTIEIEVLKLGAPHPEDNDELRNYVNALNGTIPSTVYVNSTFPYDTIKLTVYYRDAAGKTYAYLVGTDDPKLSWTQIDTTKAGTQQIRLTFDNNALYSAPATVVVSAIDSISVNAGTIQTTIMVGQTLDYSEIKIRVNYSDGSYIYADINDGISIGAIDVSTPGTKTLTISFGGATTGVEIEVLEIASEQNGMIFGASLPNYILARDGYKKNFRDQTAPYYVGWNNNFKLQLELLIFDLSKNELVEGVATYTGVSTVYLNDVPVGEEYVHIDENAHTFKFTEAAQGKTFKIETAPASAPDFKQVLVVTVVDAFNVHEAWELNVITNRDADFNEDEIFDQLKALEEFYAKKLTSMALMGNNTINGVVLHGNMNVTKNDIPEGYFYTDGELYDYLGVYHHSVPANKTFTIYGNYYSIYSYSIPNVTADKKVNPDSFSNSSLIFFETEIANSATFDHTKHDVRVENLSMRDNDPNSNDQSASERHMRGLMAFEVDYVEANFYNVNIEAYFMSILGEEDNLTLNIDNSKLYNAWQNHIFLSARNQLQDFDEMPNAYHDPIVCNVKNSLVAKCGGPVILTNTNDLKDNGTPYNRASNSGPRINIDKDSTVYSYVTGEEAWFVALGVKPLAMSIKEMSGVLSGMSGNQSGYINTNVIQGAQAINFIYLNMPAGTNPLAGGNVEGKLMMGGTFDANWNYTNGSVIANRTDDENLAAEKLIAQGGGAAPVFQSSNGGTIMYAPGLVPNPITGANEDVCIINLDPTTNGTYPVIPASFLGDYASVFMQFGASAESIQLMQQTMATGKYISLYYNGMMVTLEYYNPLNPQ